MENCCFSSSIPSTSWLPFVYADPSRASLDIFRLNTATDDKGFFTVYLLKVGSLGDVYMAQLPQKFNYGIPTEDPPAIHMFTFLPVIKVEKRKIFCASLRQLLSSWGRDFIRQRFYYGFIMGFSLFLNLICRSFLYFMESLRRV